jgi:hypothetical protein
VYDPENRAAVFQKIMRKKLKGKHPAVCCHRFVTSCYRNSHQARLASAG